MSLNVEFTHRVIVRFAEASEPYGLGIGELAVTLTGTTMQVRQHPDFAKRAAEYVAGFEWSGAQANYVGWPSDASRVFEDDLKALDATDEGYGYWLCDITDHMTGRVVGWAFVVETVKDVA